jgi:spore coat polysaccharide biosynthesis protein SpsF (cytidylyltransferase family)
MSEITNVVFGIQARSTSTRFPGKILEEIEPGKSMLKLIIRTADRSSYYLNRSTDRTGIRASYAVLMPYGDPASSAAHRSAAVIEGPEHDVLTRYHMMANQLDAQYIVRITADCPFLNPPLLSDHVKIAVANKYDYCSNVFEVVRTSMDGHDVEVISRKALEWANQMAKDPYEREHVTPIFRGPKRPDWLTLGCVMESMDESGRKVSIDTREELEAMKAEHKKYLEKLRLAEEIFGKHHVHRVS